MLCFHAAEQFKRTMQGDRFFFTHKGQAGGFTDDARRNLMQRTLAGIICDNTDITKVPEDVFFRTDAEQFLDCSEIPSLGSIEKLLIIQQ